MHVVPKLDVDPLTLINCRLGYESISESRGGFVQSLRQIQSVRASFRNFERRRGQKHNLKIETRSPDGNAVL